MVVILAEIHERRIREKEQEVAALRAEVERLTEQLRLEGERSEQWRKAGLETDLAELRAQERAERAEAQATIYRSAMEEAVRRMDPCSPVTPSPRDRLIQALADGQDPLAHLAAYEQGRETTDGH